MKTSPSAAGPMMLGQLLSESFAYGKAHAQTLVIGALISGVILGLLQGSLSVRMNNRMPAAMDGAGMDADRLAELGARMEAGDESAMDELETMLGNIDGMDATQRKMSATSMAAMTPAAGGGGLLAMAVSIIAYAFFLLVAVEGNDMSTTLSRSFKVALPILGVMIWTFIRTFVWLPMIVIVFLAFLPSMWLLIPVPIGLCIALFLFYYPRFLAAPLILLMEGKGIMASVEDSYRRTRGYWGKILGNMIVAGLIMWILLAIVQLVAGVMFSAVPMALAIVVAVAGQFYSMGLAVFSVRLSHAILQHPRA